MISKASVARHPVHPMLVPFPIALWVFSLICDFIFHGTGDPVWSTVALYTLGAGIIGALLAALPGLFDLYSLPQSQAKRIGLLHMAINLGLVTLYVINFFWRRNVGSDAGPVILSVIGVIALAFSGWLGGELVYRHGVGVAPVDENALQAAPGESEHGFGLRLHHRH